MEIRKLEEKVGTEDGKFLLGFVGKLKWTTLCKYGCLVASNKARCVLFSSVTASPGCDSNQEESGLLMSQDLSQQ